VNGCCAADLPPGGGKSDQGCRGRPKTYEVGRTTAKLTSGLVLSLACAGAAVAVKRAAGYSFDMPVWPLEDG
jgi:hypothetical protein